MSDGTNGSRATDTVMRSLGAGQSALRRIADAALGQLTDRIPETDLDERDPAYIRETLPRWWLINSFYFRARVRGLERIPRDGPVLLVGNHSGGNVIPDTIAFTVAFSAFFGAERRFHQLGHNLVLAWPGLGWTRKYGLIAASRENMRLALDAGAAALVYPGGVNEVHRPSWESTKVDFAGRTGWIQMALERDVPIVPVVAIGGQETTLFLSRGERLARALRLKQLFRLEVLPISLSLPWGVSVGDIGHIPLPAKLTVQVLEPIDLSERYGPSPDVEQIYDDVTGLMQRTLDDLADERRLPVIG